jgi:hypothetical protein
LSDGALVAIGGDQQAPVPLHQVAP